MTATPRPRQLLRLLAGLLVASALVFVIGVSAERLSEAGEAPSEGETIEATQAAEALTDGAEGQVKGEEGETNAEGESPEGGEGAGTPTDESNEALLGLNLENPWLLGAFAATSLVLAIAVLRLGQPALLAAMLFAGAAAFLDLREVILQIQHANWLIAGLAALVALAHAAAAVMAVLAWRIMSIRSATAARA